MHQVQYGGGQKKVRCPLGCHEWFCSAHCYLGHRRSCSHEVLDKTKVVIVSPQPENELVLELIKNGISVEIKPPGRKCMPDAALLLALTHSGKEKNQANSPWGRIARNAVQRQVDAIKCQRNEGRLAILLDRNAASLWKLHSVKKLENSVDTSGLNFSVKRMGMTDTFRMIHNLRPQYFQIFEAIGFESENLDLKEMWHPKVADCLTLRIKAGLAKWKSLQYPVGSEAQQAWVLDSLLHSTRGFAKPGVAAKICDEV